jgi:GTP-binding protein
MKPVVVIIGRPNVGKSTLFNRLTKTKDALVANLSGLTRDRHYSEAKLGKKVYILVDTGGFEPLIENGIMYKMAQQTEQAMVEADAIIFVVDGRGGLTPQDKIIANKLRLLNKPIIIAVNKVEGVDRVSAVSDFYELGFSVNMFPISSSHGDGIFNMMENILSNFTFDSNEIMEDDAGITFAIIGRPNVGKSTLVNAILGEDRVIVFDEAGTTRDSIKIQFEKDDQKYTIIDTAGIRRKGKVTDKIEKFSVLKSLKSISDANIVILVLDASLDIADQDATIVGYAIDAGKSIVVAINKWDAINQDKRDEIKQNLKLKLKFLDFAEFNYISALKKRGISEVFKSINNAYNSAYLKMGTPKLTRILLEAVHRQPPTYKGNFRPKLRYAHQGGSNPPIVIVHGNSLENISKSYVKYLERSFRKIFHLVGTPLKIEFKNSENPFKNN